MHVTDFSMKTLSVLYMEFLYKSSCTDFFKQPKRNLKDTLHLYYSKLTQVYMTFPPCPLPSSSGICVRYIRYTNSSGLF